MAAKKENSLILNILIIKIVVSVICQAKASNSAMNHNLYKQVLNSSACEEHINYILTNDTILRVQFMDASLRIPRGVLKANLRDFGSYYECLGIHKEHLEIAVEGKYCVIQIPLNQRIDMLGIGPGFPWTDQRWQQFHKTESKTVVKDTFEVIDSKEGGEAIMKSIIGNKIKYLRNQSLQFELAICIPKACTTQQALKILTKNVSPYFKIREAFCRLPNDKPFVAADYVAITIFSAVGLLTLLSTTYDVRHLIVLKKDPMQANKLYTTFSAYSNTKKFFTFYNYPNTLNCLDGIRSIAMLWVLVGHVFSIHILYKAANHLDLSEFVTVFSSILWITSSPITVDTFLMIGGLLLVYSSASKLSRKALLKNLHLFYLNRLLRLFPVLATAVLLQASLLNHVSDGPYWEFMAKYVNNCRANWWATLLYVQNFVSAGNMCLGNSWYLAVDTQLYIMSPIILIWVLGGNKRSAWTALIGFFLIIIISSTIYNFTMEFQSATSFFVDPQEYYYSVYYYMNTLARAAPFYVGMILGYILHLCRGKQVIIPKVQVILLWLLSFGTTTTVFISHYFPIQLDWDNQIVDSLLNSFMRPAWAASVAWLVFACTHGYAGPINWFLTLHIFKILSKLSYAMYIFHVPFLCIINATALSPIYFTVEFSIQRTMVVLNFSLIAAFLVTILIDLPFSRLVGMFLDSTKDTKRRKLPKEADHNITENTYI